jgi:glycine/D-amino acid oxidase-like deaminating enzyme
MSARADIIVLGAGMVGVSVALHLQRRGRDVALIDRRDPGEETSYGNAGLIQREAVIPYTFPREFGVVLSYAMNNRPRRRVSSVGAATDRALAFPVLAERNPRTGRTIDASACPADGAMRQGA